MATITSPDITHSVSIRKGVGWLKQHCCMLCYPRLATKHRDDRLHGLPFALATAKQHLYPETIFCYPFHDSAVALAMEWVLEERQ